MHPNIMKVYSIYLSSVFCLLVWSGQGTAAQYLRDRNRGALVGKLSFLKHNVQGTVYAVDEDTLYIENFHYDGAGPDAYFWVGRRGNLPNRLGKIVKDIAVEKASPLPKFMGQNILLHMPHGIKATKDLKWFSVWSKSSGESFGHVMIPRSLDVPQQRVIPEFSRLAHDLRSGNITILDSKTFYVPDLYYDGLGPDAFFWVGYGAKPDNENGVKIPDENGSYDVISGYNGESIVLTLPNDLTVYDINYLGVWCVEYAHDFGHVLIPKDCGFLPSYSRNIKFLKCIYFSALCMNANELCFSKIIFTMRELDNAFNISLIRKNGSSYII
ncbi:unnamed protein product [Meganyctiphanes norvegica]|uniref:DM13 domain-containing protein n=1 Tax=Meganyctiphanes norvegica TaxID=48144 RepID=A0AAV2Q684_MEGNR